MIENYCKTNFDSYEDFCNNFEINVPDSFNFAYDIVDKYAKEDPDKLALVWCDENGENNKNFTFSQLKYYSDKTANFFMSLGIKKADPVMVVLKKHYTFWFCILALHKIGAICIPATHQLKSKDYIYRNNAADIKMVVAVSDDEVIENIEIAQNESPTLTTKVILDGSREGWHELMSGIEEASELFTKPENVNTNDDTMLIYFTSGTTGQPKMVQHDYTYPLAHIVTAKFWQNVRDNGVHFTVSDTGWAKSVWGKLYGQWIAGSAVFVYDYDKFVPSEMLKVIEKYNITTFCAPPTIYRFLIKEDLSQYDLSTIKYCVIAGEPLNPEVYNQFLKATGLKLMEGFGQTEMTVLIATFPWMEPKPGSMGRPSPAYNVDIVDEEGNSCDIGEEGEIVIRTGKERPLGLFKGYYRDKDRTSSVWYDGIYHTGDVAWKDEDGYYWFVGRTDDVIKSSGYRIGPFEVESALMEHPAVLETAITGVPDPVRGQVIKATITLSKGYEPSEELKKELQEHVKNTTAPYKYPRIIEFVKELPKTISGKIRRVELREKDEK